MNSWLRRFVSPPEPIHTVLLPEPLRGEVVTLLARDSRVDAVRLVRSTTGMNLLPTVRAVDAIAEVQGED